MLSGRLWIMRQVHIIMVHKGLWFAGAFYGGNRSFGHCNHLGHGWAHSEPWTLETSATRDWQCCWGHRAKDRGGVGPRQIPFPGSGDEGDAAHAPSDRVPLPPWISRAMQRGRYNLPANTRVYINQLAIGRDENVWELPNEFKPERFLRSNQLHDPEGATQVL